MGTKLTFMFMTWMGTAMALLPFAWGGCSGACGWWGRGGGGLSRVSREREGARSQRRFRAKWPWICHAGGPNQAKLLPPPRTPTTRETPSATAPTVLAYLGRLHGDGLGWAGRGKPGAAPPQPHTPQHHNNTHILFIMLFAFPHTPTPATASHPFPPTTPLGRDNDCCPRNLQGRGPWRPPGHSHHAHGGLDKA